MRMHIIATLLVALSLALAIWLVEPAVVASALNVGILIFGCLVGAAIIVLLFVDLYGPIRIERVRQH